MSNVINDARIATKTVRATLGALRQARPLGADHPLALWRCLWDAPGDLPIENTVASDLRIFEGLSRVITERLTVYRTFYGLSGAEPARSRQAVLKAITSDFYCNSAELEAWSLLYHRYVCLELDLSLEALSNLVSQTRRTLQRRQQLGVLRLTQELIRRERAARRRRRGQVLRARLPSSRAPFLVGRDREADLALRMLNETTSPRHLALYGAPGVGKTALALALAHCLIQQTDLGHVIWIEQPPSVWTDLPGFIACQLGAAGDEGGRLALQLQEMNALVVIDNAQAVVENMTLVAALRRQLSAARLIVCIERLPVQDFGMAYLHIPELDREAAFEAFEWQVSRLKAAQWPSMIEQFDTLFADLGGNPGALRAALIAGRRYRASAIGAQLYGPIWQQLPVQARQLWLWLAEVALPGCAPRRGTVILPAELPALLDELERASVACIGSKDSPWLELVPLARRFVESLAQHGNPSRFPIQVASTDTYPISSRPMERDLPR